MANIPKTMVFREEQLEALHRIAAAKPPPKGAESPDTWADIVREAVDAHIAKHDKVEGRKRG